MQTTHVEALERTIHRTNEWLRDIQDEMQSTDRQRAYVALRATLHALRDRLEPSEAVQLGAQFPALVRGIYYEGWRLVDKPVRLRTREEFLYEVAAESADPTLEPEVAVRAVFRVLASKVTAGEIEDVKQGLPREIRDLWPEGSGTDPYSPNG